MAEQDDRTTVYQRTFDTFVYERNIDLDSDFWSAEDTAAWAERWKAISK